MRYEIDIAYELKRFIVSLLSRKFLVAIISAFIIYKTVSADGIITGAEWAAILAPIVTWLTAEGYADGQERKTYGSPSVEVKHAENVDATQNTVTTPETAPTTPDPLDLG